MSESTLVFEVDGIDYSKDVCRVTLRTACYVAPPNPTFGEVALAQGAKQSHSLYISHSFPLEGWSELQLIAFSRDGDEVEYALWPNGKPGPMFSGRAIVQHSVTEGLSFEWPCVEMPKLARVSE